MLLYAATLLVGATLLFAVQPMVAKMILPLLGGTPAVWSTCMVFFQAALLGGYAYAHASTAWLGVSRQAVLHLAVLALPLIVLPLDVDRGLARGGAASPVLDVLALLSVSVGLPFLVVSATAPLLQRWFSHTGHPAARDPYFLYAASNLGSMLALLGYPTVIEPTLPLRGPAWLSQTRLWSAGYLVLAVLMVLCALTLRRSGTAPLRDAMAGIPGPPAAPEEASRDALAPRRRVRWVALAFVPSSLFIGVTTYITTDLAAVPLFWVLPLALYLLSFILAFGRWPARLQRVVAAAAPPLALLVIFLVVSGFQERLWVSLLVHFLMLLVVALACHGELALDRPPPRRLTEFYLLISLGGVLGGLFNGLVAPLLFSSLAEYPLVMALAAVLIGSRRAARRGIRPAVLRPAILLDVALAAGIGVLAFVLHEEAVQPRLDFDAIASLPGAGWVREWRGALELPLNKVLVYAPPLVASLLVRRRPLAMGLALAAVLVVAGLVDARTSHQLVQARSFFGVLRVTRDPDDQGYTELRHGTTLHGRQSLDPERRDEPLSYYHREGPIGQVFAELDRRGPVQRVAVVGLGTGTLAAYARPGDVMTFYEIDPLVRDFALDPAYFTYLADARERGAAVGVELGDARVRLEAVRRERPEEQYDLIVVDAFTSDAIPVHLLTREALRLYLELLEPGGLLALHISNRHLRLEPVVANLAEDAGLGGRLLQEDDSVETEGGDRSLWAVLARTADALAGLAEDERWTAGKLPVEPRVGVWTDDFHNVLSVFRW